MCIILWHADLFETVLLFSNIDRAVLRNISNQPEIVIANMQTSSTRDAYSKQLK